MDWLFRAAVAVVVLVVTLEVGAFAVDVFLKSQHPPVESEQHGYRGTGMVQIYNPRARAALKEANAIPPSVPYAGDEGPKASTVYKNLKVLGDLSTGEFTRLMVNMTAWVSRKEGCAGCHNVADFADDSLYTKVAARRMIEMVRHINTGWSKHVAETGVNCFTCHRGQLVPPNVWFENPGPAQAGGVTQIPAGQNHPAAAAGGSALPLDPLTRYLKDKGEVRVQAQKALPQARGLSIKEAEKTYALMMNFSQALGVNCDFCHNTRAFFSWEQSPAQRVTAWHGIRMVRNLNEEFLEPLRDVLPRHRLGRDLGDAPKVACATCHNGVSKPLFGVSTAKEFPELYREPAAQTAQDESRAAP